MEEIKLTQGKVTQVDDSDYEYLNQWKWYAHKKQSDKTFYAARNIRVDGKQTMQLMHRLIMNTPDHLQVDHKDRDGLNNQRNNLRNVTNSVNTQNSPSQGKLHYKGVYYMRKGKYIYIRAQVRISGKITHIGYFETEEEAAKAYDKSVLKEYGQDAYTNF